VWKIALLAVALLGMSAAAQAVDRQGTYDKTFPLGAGGEVTVNNTNGTVEVEAWDRAEVRVQAVKKVRAGTADRAAEALDRMKVSVEASADRVAVRTAGDRDSGGFLSWLFGNHVEAGVSYTLSVPRGARVEVETVNGKVRIHGIAGAVDASTVNGSVELTDLRGGAKASTTNGGVRVDLAELPSTAAVRLETTNGGIHLTVPRDARLAIDASTVNGGIDISGLQANVSHHSRRHVEATVNGGGGGEVRLSTVNGGIKISGE
jgi:hypothetical protein